MISHKHKFIFIHIPKCAGSSIKDHFFKGMELDWRKPNYEVLYGWCPKRKIHLQHATAKQLLEMELIPEDIWKDYFKFTFVRNPWDRAYSAYLWIMKDRKINGSFKNFIFAEGEFKAVLTNQDTRNNRACHKWQQTDFFTEDGSYKLDFIGHFETLQEDMGIINERLQVDYPFEQHSKKNSSRTEHYSSFYGKEKRKLVETFYKKDIESLRYSFENRKSGIKRLKDLF